MCRTLLIVSTSVRALFWTCPVSLHVAPMRRRRGCCGRYHSSVTVTTKSPTDRRRTLIFSKIQGGGEGGGRWWGGGGAGDIFSRGFWRYVSLLLVRLLAPSSSGESFFFRRLLPFSSPPIKTTVGSQDTDRVPCIDQSFFLLAPVNQTTGVQM